MLVLSELRPNPAPGRTARTPTSDRTVSGHYGIFSGEVDVSYVAYTGFECKLHRRGRHARHSPPSAHLPVIRPWSIMGLVTWT